jgi:hypothetical protein
MKKLKRGKVPKSKHRFDAVRKTKKATNGSGKPMQAGKTLPKRKKAKKHHTPRSVPLPGMEQVRHTALDKFAHSIGEILDAEATHRADKDSIRQGALKYMHDNDISSYRFAKVEFLRSPGEEKLRVRTVKETGQMADIEDDLDNGAEDLDDAGDEAEDAAED